MSLIIRTFCILCVTHCYVRALALADRVISLESLKNFSSFTMLKSYNRFKAEKQ